MILEYFPKCRVEPMTLNTLNKPQLYFYKLLKDGKIHISKHEFNEEKKRVKHAFLDADQIMPTQYVN